MTGEEMQAKRQPCLQKADCEGRGVMVCVLDDEEESA